MRTNPSLSAISSHLLRISCSLANDEYPSQPLELDPVRKRDPGPPMWLDIEMNPMIGPLPASRRDSILLVGARLQERQLSRCDLDRSVA